MCCPLPLLSRDVAGFRGRRLEVEGGAMASSFRTVCGFAVHMKMEAAFPDFSTLRPGFKKACFQALRFQNPYGRSAKTMQYMYIFAKERFRVNSP